MFNTPVAKLLGEHLANTAILAGCVFSLTVIIALVLGVFSGIAEGSLRDRAVTVLSVLTTSVPEFASATILVAIFVYWLNWLPGSSSFSNGIDPIELVLPVAVLVIYNFGYYTRMTRASDVRFWDRPSDGGICRGRIRLLRIPGSRRGPVSR